MTRIGERAHSAGPDTIADDWTTETQNQILRAELTNALDRLRVTRQALEREKFVNAALTAKLTVAANAYRAVGQTFNAVRRGVDEVSGALSRVEAHQGRGHGGGDTAKDGDGDGDPAVATLARLVAECVHRDASARRRAEALLSRAKCLAGGIRRGPGSRAAFALARDLRVRLDHRESHIVRLTERLAQTQSRTMARSGVGGWLPSAAAAELFPLPSAVRTERERASGATDSAIAQLAAHRADVLVARAHEAVVMWLRDARDAEARADEAARVAEAEAARSNEDSLFRNASRFADDADLARVVAERDAALALAERASVGARARVDATARLLDARNREYVAAARKRLARREERKRLSRERDVSEASEKRGGGAKKKDENVFSTNDSLASPPKPRLAAPRDGAENARPGGAEDEGADDNDDTKRRRRAPRVTDPFAAHFNSSCES